MIQNYLNKKMKKSMVVSFSSFFIASISMFAIIYDQKLKESSFGVCFIISIFFLMLSMNFFEKNVSFEVGDIIESPNTGNKFDVIGFDSKNELVKLKREDKVFYIKMNQLSNFKTLDKKNILS